MAIEQYKKISEMTPNEAGYDGLGHAWFPYVITEDDGTTILNNYKVRHDELSNSVLEKIELLSLLTNGTLQTQYNGSSVKSFNVTPANIGTYTSQQIDAMIAAIISESFIKYNGTDILISGNYKVDTKRDMMYQGTFSSNITLNFTGITVSSHGTTYMFLRNIDTTNSHTITLTGSNYYLPNTNVITIPAATNIEIATKTYDNISVTTYLLGIPGEESNYITLQESQNLLNTALANYYTKTEIDAKLGSFYTKTESDAKYSLNGHTHSNLTLSVQGTTKGTYNGGTALTYDVSRTDLDVYSTIEVNSKLANYLLIPVNHTMSGFGFNADEIAAGDRRIRISNSSNTNIFRYVEISDNADITIYDTTPLTSFVAGTEYCVFIKNTGTEEFVVQYVFQYPVNGIIYGDLGTNITLAPNEGIEVITKAYNLKRIVTYLHFKNI